MSQFSRSQCMNELSPEIRWKNDELDVLPETVAQEKLHQYHSLRRFLCHFLMTYTDTAPFFEQIGLQVAPFLIEESRAWLEELMVEGQEIIAEALTIAQ